MEVGILDGIEQGIELGEKQGLLDAIELGVELKFGEEGLSIMDDLNKIDDKTVLKNVRDHLKETDSIEELQELYRSSLPSNEADNSDESERTEPPNTTFPTSSN